MNFSNLDLLHQKSESILNDRASKIKLLELNEKIISLSIEALEAFFNKKFYMFDAQVGENLCQIRAYKILLLSFDLLTNKTCHIKKDLANLKILNEKIKSIINNISDSSKNITSYYEILDKKEPLISFFKKNNIYSTISHDTIFIILSYVLHIFSLRKDKIPVAINYEKIGDHLLISKCSSKRIIHDYQKKLSQLSAEFIINISNEHPSLNEIDIILPFLQKTSDEDRCVLPCFCTTFIILQDMINKELPLLSMVERKNLHAKEIDTMVFLTIGNKHQGVFTAKNKININYPCLVTRGEVIYNTSNQIENSTQYSQRFLNTGVFDILLQNTAMHPQYSGKRLFPLRDNPYLTLTTNKIQAISNTAKNQELILKNYRTRAMDIGCCKENPQLFHLKHIYSSIISTELNKAKMLNYAKKSKNKELYAIEN
jgi:hypothetical protein